MASVLWLSYDKSFGYVHYINIKEKDDEKIRNSVRHTGAFDCGLW